MGKIQLKDSEGQVLAEANYGADVVTWGANPEMDDVRLDDYANDGFITSLETTDARRQLQKVLNNLQVHSGGPLGLGGYGGTSKLFVQPSKIDASAPTDPACYMMPVTVELSEPYRICEGSLWIFHTDCSEKFATKQEKMWMQWLDGKIVLSQNDKSVQCPAPVVPAEPPPPPPPPAESPSELIAHTTLWDSIAAFLGAPIATALSALFTKSTRS